MADCRFWDFDQAFLDTAVSIHTPLCDGLRSSGRAINAQWRLVCWRAPSAREGPRGAGGLAGNAIVYI